MSTPNCCGEVITNTAAGVEFFYCRGCKKEVAESIQLELSIGYDRSKEGTYDDEYIAQMYYYYNGMVVPKSS